MAAYMDPQQQAAFDAESRVSTLYGATSFLVAWCVGIVGLRVYTRRVILNQMGIDDYLAILSLVCPRTVIRLYYA